MSLSLERLSSETILLWGYLGKFWQRITVQKKEWTISVPAAKESLSVGDETEEIFAWKVQPKTTKCSTRKENPRESGGKRNPRSSRKRTGNWSQIANITEGPLKFSHSRIFEKLEGRGGAQTDRSWYFDNTTCCVWLSKVRDGKVRLAPGRREIWRICLLSVHHGSQNSKVGFVDIYSPPQKQRKPLEERRVGHWHDDTAVVVVAYTAAAVLQYLTSGQPNCSYRAGRGAEDG